MVNLRSQWLLLAFAGVMLLIMSSCVKIGYYNDRGEMDAEIIIRPAEDAIEDSIQSGEIHQGVSAEIVIPIARD